MLSADSTLMRQAPPAPVAIKPYPAPIISHVLPGPSAGNLLPTVSVVEPGAPQPPPLLPAPVKPIVRSPERLLQNSAAPSPNNPGLAPQRSHILEVIDHLRQRKARPDLERIAHFAGKRYGVGQEEVASEIEKLVDEGVVIKVEYKGNTSYRNSFKWKKNNRGAIMNSVEVSNKLRKAVEVTTNSTAEVIASQYGSVINYSKPTGVRIETIEQWLVAQEPETKLVRGKLLSALSREVECKRLIHSLEGLYSINPHYVETSNTKPLTNSAAGNKRPAASKHPSGGPDQKSPASKKPRRSSHNKNGLAGSGKCDFCGLTSEMNPLGLPEKMLICTDCHASAHPSCMNYGEELAARSTSSPWQCIDCKTCSVCHQLGNDDNMLFCDSCDKGFHTTCHKPIVVEKPFGTWICSRCGSAAGARKQKKKPSNGMNSGFPDDPNAILLDGDAKVVLSPLVAKLSEADRQLLQEFGKVPQWTVDEVVAYFERQGYADQANVFREQEIDGCSLLLLKRDDVLTGLSLRLGPALKLYHNYILKIQQLFPVSKLNLKTT